MDWKNKGKITELNKFRDQTHKRGGWPLLRDVKREDYQLAERELVMEYVKAADGKRAGMAMEKLVAEFRLRFPLRTQSDTGLQSLVDRLRKEYEEFGGLKPRKPRGWKQMQQSRAARGSLQGGLSRDRVDGQDQESSDGENQGEDQSGEGDDGEDNEAEVEGNSDEAGSQGNSDEAEDTHDTE